jgi:hypothetical protein
VRGNCCLVTYLELGVQALEVILFCFHCYEDALDDAVPVFDEVASACDDAAFLCYRVFKFAVSFLNSSSSMVFPEGFGVIETCAVENSGSSSCVDCNACRTRFILSRLRCGYSRLTLRRPQCYCSLFSATARPSASSRLVFLYVLIGELLAGPQMVLLPASGGDQSSKPRSCVMRGRCAQTH